MLPPKEFFGVSRLLGKSPVFVQGAGGNISWKKGGIMYVKSSGYFLKDIKPGAGYVTCRVKPLADYLGRICYKNRSFRQEEIFNAFIETHLIRGESFGIPSIETGMHAVLGRAAIHTHSVYANALGCMQGGEKILREIFPESLCVPYINPGLALAHALTIMKKERKFPPVIFLLNHGLLTHANTLDEALRLTLNVHRILARYLKNKKIVTFHVEEKPRDFLYHLFPDSVVYSQIDFQKLNAGKKQVFYEIRSMSRYIVSAIVKLQGEPRFLSLKDVNFIKNMGKEKHRIAMLRRG